MAHQHSDKITRAASVGAEYDALHLPDLKGKTLLDLGQRDTIFCDHAKSLGATKAIGLNWREAPSDEKFDVVTMRAAFQGADDLSATLNKVLELLAPNGLFIFEGGIVAQPLFTLWVPVTHDGKKRMYPTKKLWETVLLDKFTYRLIGPSAAPSPHEIPQVVYHCVKHIPNWTLISGESKQGKSSYASSLGTENVIRLDWLLRSNIARTLFKGDAIIAEAARRLKKTKDIGKTVRWIDSDEKASVIADHIIQYMPKECDLVIEGYLLSNDLFLTHFQDAAAALGIRVWHAQMEGAQPVPEQPTPAPQNRVKSTVQRLANRLNKSS